MNFTSPAAIVALFSFHNNPRNRAVKGVVWCFANHPIDFTKASHIVERSLPLNPTPKTIAPPLLEMSDSPRVEANKAILSDVGAEPNEDMKDEDGDREDKKSKTREMVGRADQL